MKYHNTKTGAVIETNCKISGDHWEKLKPTTKNSKPGNDEMSDNDEG